MPNFLKDSVNIPYGSDDAWDDETLLLEQEEWPSSDQFRTFSQILVDNDWSGWDLGSNAGPDYVFDASVEEYFDQCRLNEDGSFDTKIYVFAKDDAYELVASNGTFGSDVSNIELPKEDSVLISLDHSYSFKYKVASFIKAEWEGKAFTEEGEEIDPILLDDLYVITYDADSNSISWNGNVFGSIRYSILAQAYVHPLNVPPIPDAKENINACNIMAFKNKKVVQLSVIPPTVSTDCKTIAFNITTSDPDDPDDDDDDVSNEPVPILFTFFDYCTGEIVEPTSMTIAGQPTITDFETPIELVPGDYAFTVLAEDYQDSDEDDLENDNFTVAPSILPPGADD